VIRPRFASALAATILLAGCGGSSTTIPAQTVASPPAHVGDHGPSHIAVIVMENEEYKDIIGSPSAPFITALAHANALATAAFAITHPSLPNYLALTGGSTFGINSDCTSCSARGAGLAGQLESRHISWAAYMEDMPSPCFTGSSAGRYAKKHDPFMYYPGVVGDPAVCAHVVPMTRLATAERAHTLPRFLWITPNLCHDMHDCDTATGDRFLHRLIPPLLTAIGRHGLMILTWDEGSSNDGCCRLAAGGHIVTILAGGEARPHSTMGTATDHYSILQTIDDLLGLPRLNAATCPCTPSLQPLLR
jgi:phosphatidylinositol-3-phosphatase